MKLEHTVRREGPSVPFLNSHCEDQQNRAEHLDEQSTLDACFWQCAQCCAYSEITRKETRDDTSCCDSTEDLSDDNDDESDPADGANQSKSETHLREESVLLRAVGWGR